MIPFTLINLILVVLGLVAGIGTLSLSIIGLAELTCRLSGRKD